MPTLRRALLGLSLAALVGPAGALAAGPVFGIKALGPAARGYFTLTGAPGAALSGSVRVVNASRVAGTAVVLAADATTGRTTGAVYETGHRADVGGWLTLDRTRVYLAAGASTVVRFTARIPATAAPGDHLGGIVVRPASATRTGAQGTAKHSFHVNLVEQAIVAVQVTLPGPATQRLAITGVSAGANPGYQTMVIGLANTGTRLVKGTGIAKISTLAGRTLRRQAFTIDTFLPRTRIGDPVVLRGPSLAAGRYEASVLVRWPGGSAHLHAPLTISARQLRQVYGSRGVPAALGGPRSDSGGPGGAVLIGGAVVLLLAGIGGTVLYFRRRDRALIAALRAGQAGPTAPIELTDARRAADAEAVGAGHRSGEA